MRRLASFAVAAIAASAAQADTIQIHADTHASPGFEGHGDFLGSLTYTDLGGGDASLVISLQNTSSLSGWLTALAFDAAEGTEDWSFDAGASTGLDAAWSALTGPIDVAPFGIRTFGVSIGHDWLGGDSPLGGVAAGESATWVFNGTAIDAAVSAADFLSPHDGQNLMVRFRGFDDGSSDKLPANRMPPVPGVGGLAGLLAVGVLRRRRR